MPRQAAPTSTERGTRFLGSLLMLSHSSHSPVMFLSLMTRVQKVIRTRKMRLSLFSETPPKKGWQPSARTPGRRGRYEKDDVCHTLHCQGIALRHGFGDLRQTWPDVTALVPADPRGGEQKGGRGKTRLSLPFTKRTPFLIRMLVQHIAIID